MTKLDSDAIFDAPARRILNQRRQVCSNEASATGLHGYDRPASMRAMIGAAPMSSGRPAAVDVAMTAIPLETGWRRDEWLVADGAAQGEGSRRIYVIHTWPPRFR